MKHYGQNDLDFVADRWMGRHPMILNGRGVQYFVTWSASH